MTPGWLELEWSKYKVWGVRQFVDDKTGVSRTPEGHPSRSRSSDNVDKGPHKYGRRRDVMSKHGSDPAVIVGEDILLLIMHRSWSSLHRTRWDTAVRLCCF